MGGEGWGGIRKGKLFPLVRIPGVLKQELVGSGTAELRHQTFLSRLIYGGM